MESWSSRRKQPVPSFTVRPVGAVHRWVKRTAVVFSTLIIIVVVVSIVYWSHFFNPHKISYNAYAQSELRNAVTIQEAYFADNQRYCTSMEELTKQGLYKNKGVVLQLVFADDDGYLLTAFHEKGENGYITGMGGDIATVSKEEARLMAERADVSGAVDKDRLMEDLRTGDARAKSNAIFVLAAIKDEHVDLTDALIEALGHADEDVRKIAAIRLGEINDPCIIEPFIHALGDENPIVRSRAAESLGRLGGERAVEPLIAALNDRHPQVRANAAKSLRNIGDGRAVNPLVAMLEDHDPAARDSAAATLGKIGDGRAVKPLIAAYKETDGIARNRRMAVLKEVIARSAEANDFRSVDILIASLKDKNWQVKNFAAYALGQLKDPHSVDILTEALKEDNLSYRAFAADALRMIDDSRATGALIAALNEKNHHVRSRVAMALMRLHQDDAIQLMMDALNDTDRPSLARAIVAQILGRKKCVRATNELITALKDKDLNVRKNAATALGHIKNPEAVDILVAALKDEDENYRAAAALALGDFGALQSVDALITALSDKHRPLPEAALALGLIRDRRALEPLMKGLKHSDPAMRRESVRALDYLGDPRAMEPLIAALKDEDVQVRRRSVTGLRRMLTIGGIKSERAVDALTEALKDDAIYDDVQKAIDDIRKKRRQNG